MLLKMENDVHFAHGIGKTNLNEENKTKPYAFSFCLGCSFESDDKEFLYSEGNIAIEWESAAYYLRYLSAREQVNRFFLEESNKPCEFLRM